MYDHNRRPLFQGTELRWGVSHASPKKPSEMSPKTQTSPSIGAPFAAAHSLLTCLHVVSAGISPSVWGLHVLYVPSARQ